MTKEVKIFIGPNLAPSQEISLPNSINQKLLTMDKNQAEQIRNSLHNSWIIQIEQCNTRSETCIFTPFEPLLKKIKKINDSPQTSESIPNIESLFLKEKYFSIEGTVYIQISWDGIAKISTHTKKDIIFTINSTNQVIIDNLNTKELILSAPCATLTSMNSIGSFTFSNDQINPNQQTKMPILETVQKSLLKTDKLQVSGILLNKGSIFFSEICEVTATSLSNLGSLHGIFKLTIHTSNFNNYGNIDSSSLQIKSNTFYQFKIENITAIIKAKDVYIETSEEVKLKSGSIDVKKFTLTSLGLVENDIEIKAEKLINFTIQSTFLNNNICEANSIQIDTYDSMYNNGSIHAKDDLKITVNNKHSVFHQNGIIKSKSIDVNAEFYNRGDMLTEKFCGKGILANLGEIYISDEAKVDFNYVEQKGSLFVKKMIGEVIIWHEQSKASISSDKDTLLISSLYICKESRIKIFGSLSNIYLENDGLLYLQGFISTEDFYNQENGKLIFIDDKTEWNHENIFIATKSKKSGIFLSTINNKGQIISKYGLSLFNRSLINLGTVLVDGDFTFVGVQFLITPYSIQFPFNKSCISGIIHIYDPNLCITIEDEIETEKLIDFKVKKFTSKAKIKAESLIVQSDYTKIENDIDTIKELTLYSKTITNNAKIKSEKDIYLKFDDFYNNGEVETVYLISSGKELNNKGKIQCLQGTKFSVFEILQIYENSSITLNKMSIKLPCFMILYGTFEINSSKIVCYTPLKYNKFSIFENAKFILRYSTLECSFFDSKGEIEFHDAHVFVNNIFRTGPTSTTSFFGTFTLNAIIIDNNGIIKSNKPIKIVFGENPCNLSNFEKNNTLVLVNNNEKIYGNINSNILNLVNGKPTKTNHLLSNDIISKNSLYKITYTDSNSIYDIVIDFKSLKIDQPIKTDKNLIFNVGTLYNDSGIQSNKLEINAKKIINKELIYSPSALTIRVDDLINSKNGKIGSVDSVDMYVNNELINNTKYSVIFSQNKSIQITAKKNIDNSNGVIYAGGSINIKCECKLDNTAGLLLSLDPNATSFIKASKIINSLYYNKKGLLRSRETIKTITSCAGEIIIAGDCSLAGKVFSEDGRICIGNKLFNRDPLSFYFNAIDGGYITANEACLSVEEFTSVGSRFFFGKGGLIIKSNSIISLINNDLKNRSKLLKHIDPLNVVRNRPSLFYENENGTIDLCFPFRNDDNSTWDLTQITTTKALNKSKNINFSFTPDALKLAISLLPMQNCSQQWETSFESLVYNQNKDIETYRIIPLSTTENLASPIITWKPEVLNNNIIKLHPEFITPNKSVINSDVYSEGCIYLYSKSEMKFVNQKFYSKGKMDLVAPHSVDQVGGFFQCNDVLSITSKTIMHKPFIDVYDQLMYYLFGHQIGYDIYPNYIQAKELKEYGNVEGKSVQIKVKTYSQDGGSLKIEPYVHSKVRYEQSNDNCVKIADNVVFPSRIMADEAHFHNNTQIIGTLANINDTYKYANLSITSKVVDNEYEGKAHKSGFFSKTTVKTKGLHQKSYPSYYKGNNLIDMNDIKDNKTFLVRSTILDVLNIELSSNFIQENDYLKHIDQVKSKTVGITLPWFEDPRPSLLRSISALIDSETVADRTVSFIQTATSNLRLVNDISKTVLEGGPYSLSLLKSFSSKILTFSIGVQKDTQTTCRLQPVLNDIKCENLTIKNNKSVIKGTVKGKKIDIDTKELLVEAPVDKTLINEEVVNKSISFSPLQAAITNPAGLLPSVSYSKSTNKKAIKKATKVDVEAEKINVNADNMHVKGAKVAADKLNVDVKKDLTVETLMDEVVEEGSETGFSISLGGLGSAIKSASAVIPATRLDAAMNAINKTPLSLAPSLRHSDHKHVDKHINVEASLVGKEEGNINVGHQITNKSAKIGKCKNEKVTDDDVHAPVYLEEKIHEIKTDESNTYVIPISEAFELISAVNESAKIRNEIFSALKYKGLDDKNAMKELNSEEAKEIIKCFEIFAKAEEELKKIKKQEEDKKDKNKSNKAQNKNSNAKETASKNSTQKDDKNTKNNSPNKAQSKNSNAKATTSKQKVDKNTENKPTSTQNNKSNNKEVAGKSSESSQYKHQEISFTSNQQDKSQNSESNKQDGNKQDDNKNTDNNQSYDLPNSTYDFRVNEQNPEIVYPVNKELFNRLMRLKLQLINNNKNDSNNDSNNPQDTQQTSSNDGIDIINALYDYSKPYLDVNCFFTPRKKRLEVILDIPELKPEPLENMEPDQLKEKRIEKIFRGAVKEYYDHMNDYFKEKDFDKYRRRRFIFKHYFPNLYEVYSTVYPRYNKVFFETSYRKVDRKTLPPEIRDESVEQLRERHRQLNRYLYEYIDRKVEEELILDFIMRKRELPLKDVVKIVGEYYKFNKERDIFERKEYESTGFKLKITYGFNYDVNDGGRPFFFWTDIWPISKEFCVNSSKFIREALKLLFKCDEKK